ncbi:hypothetical protein [Planotetraspora sp. GP83]|uniref:hypothetical protein n=1 Tax=Planotetraspora sp. GP83 TaxID=3156264 RepID=UPI0035119751
MASRDSSAPLVVTLPSDRWELVTEGLSWAANHYSGPGWCWCPEKPEDEAICDDCADHELRGHRYWELRDQLRDQLPDRAHLVRVAMTLGEWTEIAAGVGVGATFLGADAGHDCARNKRDAAAMARLGTRLARRARRTHTRAAHPLAAAVLAARAAALDEEVQELGRELGDMTRWEPAPEEDWRLLDELIGRRDRLAARRARRPRRPAGTRARGRR